MNIDYEKISLAAREEASNLLVSVRQVKKIIEAYEAQKNPPEWVPLDLATVKQGQEVRQKLWRPECGTRFVAQFEGNIVIEQRSNVSMYSVEGKDWLMRVPAPKTVRVFVFKLGAEYGATTKQDITGVVGEDDIKVRE